MGNAPADDPQGIDWDQLEADIGNEVLLVAIPITRRTLDQFLFCHREMENDEGLDEISDEWLQRFDFLDGLTEKVMTNIAGMYEEFLNAEDPLWTASE